MVFIANDQASEVAQVSKETFNLPAPFVAPKLSAVLGLGLFAVSSVRRNQLDALCLKLGIQWITVIGFVPNQLLGLTCDMSRCESLRYQLDLMR